MVTARFYSDACGRIVAYSVRGHALAAPKGRDIVCAALSALADATANGLEAAGVPLALGVGEGRLDVVIPTKMTMLQAERSQALLKSLELAVMGLEKAYPKYIRVKHL